MKSDSFRPTLFIGGALSDYIPVTDHPEIQEIFPRAQFSYVQEAGHWVHSQRPADVIELMNNFLWRKGLLRTVEWDSILRLEKTSYTEQIVDKKYFVLNLIQ